MKKKFLNSNNAELLSDAVCSMMLSAAVCMLLFPVFRMNVPWGECLLMALADTLLIVLFSRKWWILPSFIGFVILLTLIISSLLETNDAVIAYINGFFQWCASGYTDILPYSANGSISVIHLGYVLPVAGLAFFFFRKLFFFYILVPVALGMLIPAVLFNAAALWPVLVLMLFVLFVSLAKMRGNKISKQKSSGITSAMLSISAIILMPVLLGVVLMVAPANNKDWKCKPFVNAVQDVINFLGFNQNQSPADGSFNMGLTGFSPLENRLGGNITVNNDVVLRVKTDTPVRLTGVVFDMYDGSRWYDSFTRQRYRYQSVLWNAKRAEIFGLNKISLNPVTQALFDKVTKPAELEVSSSLNGRTLFCAGNVSSLQSKKPDTGDIYFNNQSELFTLNDQNKFDYTFNTVVFDTSSQDFDKDMLSLEALTSDITDPALEAIRTEYLPLPDTLPQSVYDAAQEITAGCATPYEKALALKEWLSSQCEYTLTPGSPPEGEDFVASFLKEKKGYCVYFATAMTVMSRCAGLPARYVIGFGLKRNPSTNADNAYVATNAMAHAWTEIYFQGIGWVPFDATGWNSNENAVVELAQQSSGFVPPIPSSLSNTTANRLDLSEGGPMPGAVRGLLIAFGGLLVVAVIYILIRFLLLQKPGTVSRQARKCVSNRDRMDFYYRKIMQQAACIGIRQQPSDTITLYAKRIDERLGGQEMTDICMPVIRMRFGREEPSDDDVQRLAAFSGKLELRLRRELGLFGYLWARIIKRRRLT